MSIFNSKKAIDLCSVHKALSFCQNIFLKGNTDLEGICSEKVEQYLTKPSLTLLLYFKKAI